MAKNGNIGNAQSLMEKMLKSGKIKEAERLENSDILKEKPKAPTSVKLINVALSGKMDGGVGSGCTLIAGPSRHYKSGFGLLLVKAYLDANPDAVCVYYNNEFGIKVSYFENFGIPTNRILHIPFLNLELLRNDIVAKLDELTEDDKVIFFCDSLGNSSSKKELDDTLEEKSTMDLSRSRAIKSIMRMITPYLYMKNFPFVGVAHTYVDIGSYGGKQILNGGTGMYYNPDNIWVVGKSQLKESDELVGSTFNINVEKSRYVKEKAKIPIVVRWETGIAKYSGFSELALNFGIVQEGKKGRQTTLTYNKIDGTVIETLLKRNDNDDKFWETVLKETDLQYRIEKYYSIPVLKMDSNNSDVVNFGEEDIDNDEE